MSADFVEQYLAESVSFYLVHCNCGGIYGIPERYRAARERDAGTWHCPFCQTAWGYRKSEAAKLREQLIAQEERTQRALSDANRLKLQLRAQKGQATKLRKRIAAGVCPCCQRTFKQLARHMKCKHPDYLEGNT